MGMDAFAHYYMEPDARRKQHRMITKRRGMVKGVSPHQFWNRISELKRYMPYLLHHNEKGRLIDDDQLREIFITAQDDGIEDLMEQANYDWEDENKTDIEVVNYVNRLHLILNKSKPKRSEKE